MGQLPYYNSLSEKEQNFNNDRSNFKIDTVNELDEWYEYLIRKISENKTESKLDSVNTDHIFRGLREAKFKLLTSSQRFWISNELKQWWRPKSYLKYVNKFVKNARDKLLFKKVFEYYNLKSNQRNFPILSILQHYGAPIPLMDWSYSINVTLYFATQKAYSSYSQNNIDHYFSVYHIDKRKQKKNEFNNLLDWSGGSFPRISSFYDWEKNKNSIFYISDFESKIIPSNSFKDERPITTFYNQNIIPQEGLFIFNPFPTKPLEDCFNTDHWGDGNNLELLPFSCINIRKDLGEYIRRKIKTEGIDENFIYPNLKTYCNNLTSEFLDSAAK